MAGMDKKAIGRRLKEYRRKAGLTQDELAEKVGLSPHYYSAIERGASFPRIEKLVLILNVIGASADQIFVDVVDRSGKAQASHLWEDIQGLPPDEQRRILRLVEAIGRDAKEQYGTESRPSV